MIRRVIVIFMFALQSIVKIVLDVYLSPGEHYTPTS